MGRKFILITGRSTRQGRTIHLGKEADAYVDEISTLELNPIDMEALSLADGEQVRISNEHGSAVVHCKTGTIPEGLAFIPYGAFVNRLVGPDTQGTGMPDSKGFEIEVEKNGSR
ncbi:MAG: formylmethanofuran dehydrogenase [Acidobacteria bacterium]|nr:formylmethanofuran dehydrogenase [Acidobacteriota bacterium]